MEQCVIRLIAQPRWAQGSCPGSLQPTPRIAHFCQQSRFHSSLQLIITLMHKLSIYVPVFPSAASLLDLLSAVGEFQQILQKNAFQISSIYQPTVSKHNIFSSIMYCHPLILFFWKNNCYHILFTKKKQLTKSPNFNHPYC